MRRVRCTTPKDVGAWLSLLLFCLLLCGVLPARAEPVTGSGLLLSPTRIVFENGERSAVLRVINTGDTATTYRINWVHMGMNDSGMLVNEQAPRPGEAWVDDLILFAPHVVTLPPRSSQNVRLLVRAPTDLAPGEYRSHLQVQALPPADTGKSVEAMLGKSDGSDAQESSVVLRPVFGLAIPVIVRQEPIETSVALSDLAIEHNEHGEMVLTARLQREGNASVYGDVAVSLQTADGKRLPVGEVKGVAIYNPVDALTLRIPLEVAQGTRLEHGTLLMSYNRTKENGGVLLAKSEIQLP